LKNQYFGDINDYRKYGLLAVLTNRGEIKPIACSMLTRDDESVNGNLMPLTCAINCRIILSVPVHL
jgi:hypothetical protein